MLQAVAFLVVLLLAALYLLVTFLLAVVAGVARVGTRCSAFLIFLALERVTKGDEG